MTRASDLGEVRELLQRQRRTLLQSREGARRELHALKNQEKDPEFEEAAQAELADYTLSSLMEGQRRELVLIDAALRRMEEGVFGMCVDCELPIPIERLMALPFALRCEEDATRAETERRQAQATQSAG